ncbi:MAG TPA: hypothetical protein VE291_13385 [Terracidiphilus sp.]|jgi:hypothetical protein|nr:hypothetical protein [Terracidiphilus sp.]
MLRSILLGVSLAALLPAAVAAQDAAGAAQAAPDAKPQTDAKPDAAKPGQTPAKPAPPPPAQPAETIIPLEDKPTAYRIVAINSQYGTPQTVTTYRSGERVLIDEVSAAKGAQRMRTLYNLTAHTTLTWTWPNTEAGCAAGRFTGDWGDPYAPESTFNGPDSKLAAEEPIRGSMAYVMEGPVGDGMARAWIDPSSGLLLKAQLTPKGGAPQTVLEVTEVDKTPPADAVFAPPAACANAAEAPPLTAQEQLARLTGGKPGDFVAANVPPPPPPTPAVDGSAAGGTQADGGGAEPAPAAPALLDACTVVFRVVRAGSMMPLTSGFQTAIDLTLNGKQLPSYSIGISPEGYVTFDGGGLHEVTRDFRDGALRIEHAPAQFEIDTEFGNAGAGHALIYRQCFAPETTLVFVVKNPGRLSDGGQWLWLKSVKPTPKPAPAAKKPVPKDGPKDAPKTAKAATAQ